MQKDNNEMSKFTGAREGYYLIERSSVTMLHIIKENRTKIFFNDYHYIKNTTF